MLGTLRRSPILAAAACLALAGIAHASTRINIGSMTADGQEVRNLSCDLDSGGFFAGIAIVGGLAKKKKAFDACIKSGGAAFQVSWRWDGSSAKDLKVTGGSDAQNACIGKAFQVISGPVKGKCSAVLLAGKKEEAQKAAETLTGKADAKADAKPAESKPEAPAAGAAGGKAAGSDPLK